MKVRLVGGPKDGTKIEMGEVGSLSYEVVIPKIEIGISLGRLIYQRRGNWSDGFYYKFKREDKIMLGRSLIEIFNSMKGKGLGNGTPIKV